MSNPKRQLPVQWVGKAKEAGLVESELKHILYDLSIEDVEERKRKAKVFDTANEVADYLGINVDIVFRNRMPNKRIKGINKKEYAVRVIKK